MDLFNLVAKIVVDDSDYKKGINNAKKDVKGLESQTEVSTKKSAKQWLAQASAIMVVVTAIVKLINGAIKYGDEIDKQSQKLNMSNQAYQKWSLALSMAGTNISTMQMAMKTFTDILDRASKGQADALITLEKLGIGYEDLIDLEPEEAFKLVVEELQKMEQGAAKTQLAIDLFGRSGQELLPLLNQEVGSIDELFKSFEDLGLIMDDAAVEKSAELDDKLTILGARLKMFAVDLGESFYTLVEGLDKFMNSSVVKWYIEGLSDTLEGAVKIASEAANIFLALFTGDLPSALESFKNLFKSAVNFWIDTLNTFIKGLNKFQLKLPNWDIFGKLAGKEFGINIPLIPRLQRGASFIPSDMYPAYLDYGERVLTRKENEEYTAFGGVRGIEAIVNGIGGMMRNNASRNNNPVVINVKIGEKEIKDYIFEAVDSTMKSRGYKSLSKVGAY